MTDDPTAATSTSSGAGAVNGGGPTTWEAPAADARPQARAVESIEQLEVLDGPAQAVAGVVKKLVPPGAVKDALSGTWLGHPLHPLLTAW